MAMLSHTGSSMSGGIPSPSIQPTSTIAHDGSLPVGTMENNRENWVSHRLFQPDEIPGHAVLALFQFCVKHKNLYTPLNPNTIFWEAVSIDFNSISGWEWSTVKDFVKDKLRKHRGQDYAYNEVPLDLDGYRIEALVWELNEHFERVMAKNEPRNSSQSSQTGAGLTVQPTSTIPPQAGSKRTFSPAGFYDRINSDDDSLQVHILDEDPEDIILQRSKCAKMRCDFDQARWLLLLLQDKEKARAYLAELESSERLHDEREAHHELESTKAESDGDWEKAKILLHQLENNTRAKRLLSALKKRQEIQAKYNEGLRGEIAAAQFDSLDLTKACSLVTQMKGKRPQAFVTLFKCNKALANNAFEEAQSVLDNSSLPRVQDALKSIVALAKSLHNDRQDSTSLALAMDMRKELHKTTLVNSSGEESAETCDGHIEVTVLESVRPKPPPGNMDTVIEKVCEEFVLCGHWDEAKDYLLTNPNKIASGPILRRLEEQRSALNKLDENLERQAKEAELNGDWDEAKSLLSCIKSDFGKFLLKALEYSQARLSQKEEHLELLVQLKKDYPDRRLRQVELTQFIEYAKIHGPPGIAHDQQSLFAGEKMLESGVLWKKPDDFRKVFEMMAEDMRDDRDRVWHRLEPRESHRRPALDADSAKVDALLRVGASIRRQDYTSECFPPSTSSEMQDLFDVLGFVPNPTPWSKAGTRDPCIVTSSGQVIREYRTNQPALRTLPTEMLVTLCSLCLTHKELYNRPQGSGDFWHRVANHFWEDSGWDWERVRRQVQYRIRVWRDNPSKLPNDPEGDIKRLVGELVAHINSVQPAHLRIVPRSPGSPRVPKPSHPVEVLTLSAVKRAFSQTGLDDESHWPGLKNCVVTYAPPPKKRAEEPDDDFDKAKSTILQISNRAILDPLLEALDATRETQIRVNEQLEKQAREADSKGDWETARSLLSRVVSKDKAFLLMALDYSESRIDWSSTKAYNTMNALLNKFPDPRLDQVDYEREILESAERCRRDRKSHYQSKLRDHRSRFGRLWSRNEDFRKVFQIIAADMRRDRDKEWYANPPRARKA